jgi:hypothetical protein
MYSSTAYQTAIYSYILALFVMYIYLYTFNVGVMCYTGWGAQSWTVFCRPAAVAVGGCERKD